MPVELKSSRRDIDPAIKNVKRRNLVCVNIAFKIRLTQEESQLQITTIRLDSSIFNIWYNRDLLTSGESKEPRRAKWVRYQERVTSSRVSGLTKRLESVCLAFPVQRARFAAR